MKTIYVCLLVVLGIAPLSGQAHATAEEAGSQWLKMDGGLLPQEATSVGIDRQGGQVFACRGRSEGVWQLGIVRGEACVHHGEKQDTVHLKFDVLSLSASSLWQSMKGSPRGVDLVQLGLGANTKGLCRVRQTGRTHLGELVKKGCRLRTRQGDVRTVTTYEALVDPEANERAAYQGALGEFRKIVAGLNKWLIKVDTGLEGNSTHADLTRLSSKLTPTVATARRSYERLEKRLSGRQREYLRRLYVQELEPLLSRLARARDGLAVAALEAKTLERCRRFEADVRRTVDLLTSDSALARRLKARQRISVLTEMQARLNDELKRVRVLGNQAIRTEVEGLFRPLPSLLSDAVYHLQPWLEAGERNALYGAYLGGLTLSKPGSASKGLRRLLELFRSSDTSRASAQAVDSWLKLMDNIAATIEQRDLPLLPKASATSFRGFPSKTFALNLKRNGFSWLETQLDPDELDSGQTSRYLITPNLNWILRRLNQKVPADVVARVRCLRQQMWSGVTFAEQLNACDSFWLEHPKSALSQMLRQELETLVKIHAQTLDERACKRFVRRVSNTSYKNIAESLCLVEQERVSRAEVLRVFYADVRRFISQGKLRKAKSLLKKLRAQHPNAAIAYQLQYELKRAEQQKAEERLSAAKYAGRLQSIERRLPALEEVCIAAGRQYRRARKRMRLALRKGLDGRATRHKLNHDRAFYRACEARDEVQELLNAQVATGLVQAVRVTKETAPTCLKQWSICDRSP